MKTFTYNSANLSSKERLTITSLLTMFVSRLNAKWVSVNDGQGQAPDVVLVDADKPEGRQTLEGPKSRETLIPVTEDDRWPRPPFISRPIRAYGPSGVVVLFNSVGQALETPVAREVSGTHREPALRMTGRLEATPPPVRTTTRPLTGGLTPRPASASIPSLNLPRSVAPVSRAPSAHAAQPVIPQTVPPQTTEPRSAPQQSVPQMMDAPAPGRVAVRWGPPEPIVLPPLKHMPGARIHEFGRAAARQVLDLPNVSPAGTASPSTPAQTAAQEVAPTQLWRAPEPENPTLLVSMPVSHRPVELHRPPMPVIGRARIAPSVLPAKPTIDVDEVDLTTPVLRAVPSHWRPVEADPVAAPAPITAPSDTVTAAAVSVDAQEVPVAVTADPAVAPAVPVIVPAATLQELASEVTETPAPSASEPVAPEDLALAPASEAATLALVAFVPAEVTPVDLELVEHEPDAAPAVTETAGIEAAPDTAGNPREEPAELVFSDIAEGLQSLSEAIGVEVAAEEFAGEDSGADAGADWWGTAQFESDLADASLTTPNEGSLLSVIKAIKASNQPSILEIAGLPAVCVIPARNIYFTTAPAARLETALGARSVVTWRSCSSEAEARQLSGTEQSRQVSVEQLFWTASLLNAAPDTDALADRVVRLRRWPPLTESRTRSKFVRYATLLSGAHATPRELAEITGDPLDDIVTFVQACGEMNLLETSEQAKAPVAAAPLRTQGAGILRGIIEQLTPPKV